MLGFIANIIGLFLIFVGLLFLHVWPLPESDYFWRINFMAITILISGLFVSPSIFGLLIKKRFNISIKQRLVIIMILWVLAYFLSKQPMETP